MPASRTQHTGSSWAGRAPLSSLGSLQEHPEVLPGPGQVPVPGRWLGQGSAARSWALRAEQRGHSTRQQWGGGTPAGKAALLTSSPLTGREGSKTTTALFRRGGFGTAGCQGWHFEVPVKAFHITALVGPGESSPLPAKPHQTEPSGAADAPPAPQGREAAATSAGNFEPRAQAGLAPASHNLFLAEVQETFLLPSGQPSPFREPARRPTER